MKTHKDLDVWKNAIDLVTSIYSVTKNFPVSEIYSLSNQIRRSATSIPSNIAEGAGRSHNKEFIQFLSISLGSLSELETQIIISKNLDYISNEILSDLQNRFNLLRAQISGLIKYLKNN